MRPSNPPEALRTCCPLVGVVVTGLVGGEAGVWAYAERVRGQATGVGAAALG